MIQEGRSGSIVGDAHPPHARFPSAEDCRSLAADELAEVNRSSPHCLRKSKIAAADKPACPHTRFAVQPSESVAMGSSWINVLCVFRRAPPHGLGLRGTLRVLIADDDDAERRTYAAHLRARGWDVQEVSSAEDAVGVASAFRPHVIVMDILRPALEEYESGFDARDAVRRLQEHRATREIPVVALAYFEALDDEEDAEDFLTRTITPDELASALESVVERERVAAGRLARRAPR